MQKTAAKNVGCIGHNMVYEISHQVVDAQGSPLYIGGQPSHFDSLVMMMLRSRVGGGVEVGNFPKNHPIW